MTPGVRLCVHMLGLAISGQPHVSSTPLIQKSCGCFPGDTFYQLMWQEGNVWSPAAHKSALA